MNYSWITHGNARFIHAPKNPRLFLFSSALSPCKKQTWNKLRKKNNICIWEKNRNSNAETKQPGKKKAKALFFSLQWGQQVGAFQTRQRRPEGPVVKGQAQGKEVSGHLLSWNRQQTPGETGDILHDSTPGAVLTRQGAALLLSGLWSLSLFFFPLSLFVILCNFVAFIRVNERLVWGRKMSVFSLNVKGKPLQRAVWAGVVCCLECGALFLGGRGLSYAFIPVSAL